MAEILIFMKSASNLETLSRDIYRMGLKIYNRLPTYIKAISQNNKVLTLRLLMSYVYIWSTYS